MSEFPTSAARNAARSTVRNAAAPAAHGPSTVSEGDTLELLGLLADQSRLRVFAAVVLGARRTPEIAEHAGLSNRGALEVLAQLESGGLARREADGWRLRPERIRDVVIAAVPADERMDPGVADPSESAVLRALFRGGRLVQIPAQRGKRLVVLDHVARVFEPGLRYPEREVNVLLRAFHPDYVALRRHLVDEGLLSRSQGVYWRNGGTVSVAAPRAV
ncbi:MAG: DUF2087 domain-containing protein [Carbonactinosporaceae bacterium]